MAFLMKSDRKAYRQQLSPKFPKKRVVFQIAPMAPLFELLVLRLAKKQSEWLQRELPLLEMPEDSLQKKRLTSFEISLLVF